MAAPITLALRILFMDPRRKRRAAVAAAMMIALLSFDAAVVVVVCRAPWKRAIAMAIWQGEERTMSMTTADCVVAAGDDDEPAVNRP